MIVLIVGIIACISLYIVWSIHRKGKNLRDVKDERAEVAEETKVAEEQERLKRDKTKLNRKQNKL